MLTSNLILILFLIGLNGFFAAVELALVSSRKTRLRSLAEQGDKGAHAALKAKERTGHYLAAVQVGISLVGSLASAVGGASAVPVIAEFISDIEILAPYADQLALIIIVLTITYLSLVLGELVPKQLALRNPEALASRLIAPVSILARVAALPIRLLSISTDAVLRILAPSDVRQPSTSSEEIEQLLQEGTAEGIFQLSESRFVSGVFDYGDRRAQDVMTARTEMVALDSALKPQEALNAAAQSNFSRFPIYQETIDHIVGYVHLKDLIWAEESTTLKDIARQIIFMPAKATLPAIYKRLTQERTHQAIVLDEHGGTAGLLTLEDVLEVIVGEIDDEYNLTPSEVKQLGRDTWLVDGGITIDELAEEINADFAGNAVYSTLAGLVLAELGHIPESGESFNFHEHQFTVRKVDKLRIESVEIHRASPRPA